MPSPRNFDAYPSSYLGLFVLASENPIRLHCDDRVSIQSDRNELYNFRFALYEKAEEDPSYLPDALLASLVEIKIEGDYIYLEPAGKVNGRYLDELKPRRQ